MTKVYLAQMFCPARHYILGMAGVYETPGDAEALRPALQKCFDGIYPSIPYCGICGMRASLFHIEVEPTKFDPVSFPASIPGFMVHGAGGPPRQPEQIAFFFADTGLILIPGAFGAFPLFGHKVGEN